GSKIVYTSGQVGIDADYNLAGSDLPFAGTTRRRERLWRHHRGWTAAVKGEAERAALIIGGAEQIWHTIGSRQMQGKGTRYEALARAAVGDARFETARERGRQLSTGELVRYALRENPASDDRDPASPHLTKREREVAARVCPRICDRRRRRDRVECRSDRG